jgi:hypothetical protein
MAITIIRLWDLVLPWLLRVILAGAVVSFLVVLAAGGLILLYRLYPNDHG